MNDIERVDWLRRVVSTRPMKIYYTDGDWSARWYEANGISQLCHKHPNGTTYIIPFGYSRDNGYKCHECDETAPHKVVAIWVFVNWDNANWDPSLDAGAQ